MARTKRVQFSGYDGKCYSGLFCGYKNGIATVSYTVPGVGVVKALLPKKEVRERVEFLGHGELAQTH